MPIRASATRARHVSGARQEGVNETPGARGGTCTNARCSIRLMAPTSTYVRARMGLRVCRQGQRATAALSMRPFAHHHKPRTPPIRLHACLHSAAHARSVVCHAWELDQLKRESRPASVACTRAIPGTHACTACAAHRILLTYVWAGVCHSDLFFFFFYFRIHTRTSSVLHKDCCMREGRLICSGPDAVVRAAVGCSIHTVVPTRVYAT